MKNVALVLAIALSSAACSTLDGHKVCSEAQIRYVESASVAESWVGRFEVTHMSGPAILIALDGPDGHVAARSAVTEQRPKGSPSWRIFNPILEEVAGPTRSLRVSRGKPQVVLFDANGLFVPGQADEHKEYSVVFRDINGCEYRSEPFTP